MSEETTAAQPEVENHGWRVTFAGMGINLALGILYTWSVISKRVPEDWGWNEDDKSLPYMFACLIFSLIMVPAGRMQDKIGPRVVAAIGGILVGIGFIIASTTSSVAAFVVGFGVLAGAVLGKSPSDAVGPILGFESAGGFGLHQRFLVPARGKEALADQRARRPVKAARVFFFPIAIG